MSGQDHLMRARQDNLPRAAALNHLAADTTADRRRRRHRPGLRLWTLLHAQSLLNGLGSGPHAVAFMEDDYRRLRTPELLPRFLAGERIDEPFERWN